MSILAIKDKFCGVEEAADILGCTTGRIRQLLLAGLLAGEKVSEAPNAPWLVERKSIDKHAAVEPTTGRPRRRSVEAG